MKCSPLKPETVIQCFDPSYDPYDFTASQKVEVSSTKNILMTTHYTQKTRKQGKMIKFTLKDLIDIGDDSAKVLKYLNPDKFITSNQIKAALDSRKYRSLTQYRQEKSEHSATKFNGVKPINDIIKLPGFDKNLIAKKRGVEEKNTKLNRMNSNELMNYMANRKDELRQHLKYISTLGNDIYTEKPIQPDYFYTVDNRTPQQAPEIQCKSDHTGFPMFRKNTVSDFKNILVETSTFNKSPTVKISHTRSSSQVKRMPNNYGFTQQSSIAEWEDICTRRKSFNKIVNKIEESKTKIHMQMQSHRAKIEKPKSKDEMLQSCQRLIENHANFNIIYRQTERSIDRHLKAYVTPKKSLKDILLQRKVTLLKDRGKNAENSATFKIL